MNKKNLIISLLIIALGILFRTYHFNQYLFGIDQVQIAENSEKIIQGDFVLIGPRTGPAHLFTGPLIYYTGAFFNLFMAPEFAVIANCIFLSLITGTALLFLSNTYLSNKNALFILTIWACSPFIIKLDRIPWNPNLILLTAALVFFPFLKNKMEFKDHLLVLLGIFLGYQAHFSGLLLLPLAFLSYFLTKQKIKNYFLAVIAFIISILPTIIFDFRNNFLNYKGLSQLLLNKDKVASFNILPRLLDKTLITVETLGKIFFVGNERIILLFAGFLILAIFISKNIQKAKLSLAWLLTITIFLAFYRESTPEYYFLISLPILIFITADFLQQLSIKPINTILVIISFGLFSTLLNYKNDMSFSLNKQIETVNYLTQINNSTKIKEIIYDMKPIDQYGIKYLIQKHPFNNSEGKTIHLIYPYYKGPYTIKISDDLAVWIDPRTNENKKYFTTDEFILEYNPDLLLQTNVENNDSNIYVFDSKLNYVNKLDIQKINDKYQIINFLNLENNSLEDKVKIIK